MGIIMPIYLTIFSQRTWSKVLVDCFCKILPIIIKFVCVQIIFFTYIIIGNTFRRLNHILNKAKRSNIHFEHTLEELLFRISEYHPQLVIVSELMETYFNIPIFFIILSNYVEFVFGISLVFFNYHLK